MKSVEDFDNYEDWMRYRDAVRRNNGELSKDEIDKIQLHSRLLHIDEENEKSRQQFYNPKKKRTGSTEGSC